MEWSRCCNLILYCLRFLYPLPLCKWEKKFNLKEFYLRRYIRIGIPILIALLLVRITKMVDEGNKDWLAGIPAWSLVAEIIYYSIYPLLYKVLKEKWVIITLFSFIISLFFSFTADPENYNYPAWGYWGDWILGLPVG